MDSTAPQEYSETVSPFQSLLGCIPARFYRHPHIWLFLLTIIIGLFLNGQRPLYDSSETRYAEAAREMAVSGNWLVPKLAGIPHLTKPPLTYWFLAAAMKAFGKSDFVMRLPGTIFYALQPLMVYLLVESMLRDRRAAFFAGLLDAIAPILVIGGYVVTTDVFLSCFELAYMLGAWKCLAAANNSTARKWVFFFYGAIVCAFLTKGPPGLLALLSLIVFCLWCKPQSRRRLLNPVALILSIILSILWYAIVLIRVPLALEIWKQEALTKVLVSSNRDMSALLYLPIFFLGAFPATALVIYAVRLKRKMGWHPSPWRTWLARPAETSFLQPANAIRFLALWIAIPLVIFMLAKTRLPLYVLPIVAAWCALACVISAGTNADIANPEAAIAGERANTSTLSPSLPSLGLRCCRVLMPLLIIWVVLLMASKSYFIIWPDESKDFTPIAAAIRNDVEHSATKPEIVLTMPLLGHGVLYYLDGPPSQRTVTEAEVVDNSAAGKTARLAKVFRQPVPAGVSQYIVLQKNDQVKYEDVFALYIKPIFQNSQWAVWKRTAPQSITITFEKHRHRKAKAASSDAL